MLYDNRGPEDVSSVLSFCHRVLGCYVLGNLGIACLKFTSKEGKTSPPSEILREPEIKL